MEYFLQEALLREALDRALFGVVTRGVTAYLRTYEKYYQ
jgi:hypothetical protein